MANNVQAPTITPSTGCFPGDIWSHPAYGQISISQVSGGVHLYGSDFMHNQFVSLRISASTMRRDLSHDWYSSGREYIEVYMTQSQWATFVSAMNQGNGPCCTIASINGQPVPELPPAPSRTKQFSGEFREHLTGVVEQLQELQATVSTLKLSKVQAAALQAALTRAQQDLTTNLAFVAESFDKFAENTVEKAKAEVHGYMATSLSRLGVMSLQTAASPISLEPPPEQLSLPAPENS